MKIHFAYNLDRDVENIINGARALNNKKPTKFQNLFSEKYGDTFEVEKIKKFIGELDEMSGFDANNEIVAAEKRWKMVESVFL